MTCNTAGRLRDLWRKGTLGNNGASATQQRLDTIGYLTASLFIKAVTGGSAKPPQWKPFNGRKRGWAKGVPTDRNADWNELSQLKDCELTRYTTYKKIQQIVLMYSPAPQSVKGLELVGQPYQPSADKPCAHLCAFFQEQVL